MSKTYVSIIEGAEEKQNSIFKYKSFRNDIIDLEDRIEIIGELPGINKEDIDVDFRGQYLRVKVLSKPVKNEEYKYLLQEIPSGCFYNKYLISNIDIDGITASYENGLLKIVLPKEDKIIKCD